MTERTIYECDGCGERFGYKNTIREYPIIHRAPNRYTEPVTETLLACVECEADFGLRSQQEIYHTQSVVGWGVDNHGVTHEVTGALYEDTTGTEGYTKPMEFLSVDEMGHPRTHVAEFVEEVLL